MPRTVEHTVENRFLPQQWQNKVWTTFEDISLIEVGTVFFDPHGYARYVGEVTNIITVNGHCTLVVRWWKGLDSIFNDTYRIETMAKRGFWWLDPAMQEDFGKCACGGCDGSCSED